MKKLLWILLAMIMLTGCGAKPTMETVEDIIPVEPVAIRQQLYVQLPEDAAAPVLRDDSGGELYQCQDYTLTKQILTGGDLERTLQSITGQNSENLQILKTKQDEVDRYDFVWSAAAEDGLQIGRGCVLDDHHYHYVVSTTAEESASVREVWQDLFSTCRLIDPEVDLNTGS